MVRRNYWRTVMVTAAIGFVVLAICVSFTVSRLMKERDNLASEVGSTRSSLYRVYAMAEYTRQEVGEKEAELAGALEELKKLQSGKRYILHDPSYREVQEFLLYDNTDRIPYNEESFTCMHYAQRVNNNAEEKGIRCAYVYVELRKGAHACVAFQIPEWENQLLFIEPQTDERVRLGTWAIGKDYWADCVEIKNPDYYYERDPNNIVENFVLYW